ncbi:Crp/Fnr family transcriptional regulator [uncultured Friedmanniella sp.]|uniref:Crp/Fnr family transcriptional regulator n=1 Tax=uncultured Friedmanniella sp. TaxID=335381 RepID=UPI0035CB41A0
MPTRGRPDGLSRGLLAALPPQGRDAVLSAARHRSFAVGERLVRQGEDALELFLLNSGWAAVRLGTPRGDSVTLAVLCPGDVFGETGALNTRQQRTATVQALDAVTTLVVRWDDLEVLRRSHPEVNDFLLALLGRRIERLSRLVVEAHHLPAARRVARRLYELGRQFAADGTSPLLPLSQEEVAQIAGTTRPTTNQVLKRLEADGVIALARGRIELRNLPELRSRCSW